MDKQEIILIKIYTDVPKTRITENFIRKNKTQNYFFGKKTFIKHGKIKNGNCVTNK